MTKDTGNKIKRQVRNDGQFADRIRQLRLAAGLTQPQLAAKLGVTKTQSPIGRLARPVRTSLPLPGYVMHCLWALMNFSAGVSLTSP